MSIRAGAGRKVQMVASSAVVLLATTVACVLLGLLLDRFALRVDVTALGEHRLSPRTTQLVEGLDADHEIVLAGPWRELGRLGRSGDLSADPRAVQATLDVLREFDRASGRLDATIIDTSTEAGQTQYRSLLGRLESRDAAALAERRRLLAEAFTQLEQAIGQFGSTARALDAMESAVIGVDTFADQLRRELRQRAAVARAVETQQRDQLQAARGLLMPEAGSSDLVAVDDASGATIGLAQRLDAELTNLAEVLRALTEDERVPESVSQRAAPEAARVRATRDALAVRTDALVMQPALESVRVARLLAVGPAALVIGPADRAGSITGISFDALFPLLDAERAATGIGADARQHAEEIFFAAISAVGRDDAPILIFVHGEARRGLLQGQAIDSLQRRLGLRRIDLLEWPAAIEPDPPSTLPLDPDQTRPVVFVTLGTDSRPISGLADQSLNGPARVAALGRALSRLAERGEAMLVGVNVSVAPMTGRPDEAAVFLRSFGLEADTGRPLVSLIRSGEGNAIDVETRAGVPADTDHPLADPLRGLVTTLRWAVPLKPVPATGGDPIRRTTLLAAPGQDRWAESDWQGLFAFAAREGVSVMRGQGLPQPTAGLDDTAGPWPVAVAAERDLPGLKRPQRVVIVGANGWFFDAQTQASVVENGRQVLTSPGNLELFENSIAWLTFRDDQIAQTAATGSIPRIEALSAGERRLIGWLLIAGLPVLVLALGVAFRLLRG